MNQSSENVRANRKTRRTETGGAEDGGATEPPPKRHGLMVLSNGNGNVISTNQNAEKIQPRGRRDHCTVYRDSDGKEEETKEETRKRLKEESNEEVKELNQESKEEPKEESKEEPKEESKEEPNEEVKEESEKEVIRTVVENDPENGEYIQDFLGYMKDLERRKRPRPSYMLKHRDINSNMRAILVDWLVEVVSEFDLSNETLYLTVNIIDRFLSLMHVSRSKLQLVGVSAMLVASKVEELSPPSLNDFVYICDSTYHAEEVRLMEFQILRSLKFDLTIASPTTFCARFAQIAEVDSKTQHLAQYLCELSLQEYHFLKFLPSEIACSALILALHTLDHPHWDATLQHHTGYQLSNLLSECIPALHQLFLASPDSTLQSIREKYATADFSYISLSRAKNIIPSL